MKNKTNFEQSIKELEDIVKQLERGELSLDESLDFFQKGVELSKVCSKMLDEAEQRINILVKDKNGEVVEKPFEIE